MVFLESKKMKIYLALPQYILTNNFEEDLYIKPRNLSFALPGIIHVFASSTALILVRKVIGHERIILTKYFAIYHPFYLRYHALSTKSIKIPELSLKLKYKLLLIPN